MIIKIYNNYFSPNIPPQFVGTFLLLDGPYDAIPSHIILHKCHYFQQQTNRSFMDADEIVININLVLIKERNMKCSAQFIVSYVCLYWVLCAFSS